MTPALEAALGELVLGPELDPSDEAAVRSWLARHSVEGPDAQSILEGELERLLVYRTLVRKTLRGALELSIPRSMARLGPLFDESFDRFLRERGPRSRYLRDVTGELLDFCAPLWRADPRVPSYITDLARHEALHIEIASTPRAGAARAVELDLGASLAFVEASRVMHYQHAVHRLPDDVESREAPEPQPTDLFVYRAPDHEVRYLELTPLAARILERLLGGQALGECLSAAATELGIPLDDDVLTGTARLLADLSERGALLGPTQAGKSRPGPKAE